MLSDFHIVVDLSVASLDTLLAIKALLKAHTLESVNDIFVRICRRMRVLLRILGKRKLVSGEPLDLLLRKLVRLRGAGKEDHRSMPTARSRSSRLK
jgi:hypothetical protein